MSFFSRCVKDFIIHDRTVCAYFDLEEIERNARALQSLSDERTHFIFPVKSFPNTEVLALVADILNGFDISNENEGDMVQHLRRDQGLVWSSSPAPWNSQIVGIFMDGAHLEAPWVEGTKRSLRVNLNGLIPAFVSRFGTSVANLTSRQLIDSSISALHFHHGEEPFNRLALPLAIDKMAELVRGNQAITHVNLGGGFEGLSMAEIEATVSRARAAFPHQQIVFEPGRWLCGDAGKLIGRVTDVSMQEVAALAMTTISRDCHLRWQHPNFKVSLSSMGLSVGVAAPEILIVGATCSESDRIATLQGADLKVARGDLAIIHRLPGYSAAWNHSFNGVPSADIVFLHRK